MLDRELLLAEQIALELPVLCSMVREEIEDGFAQCTIQEQEYTKKIRVSFNA